MGSSHQAEEEGWTEGLQDVTVLTYMNEVITQNILVFKSMQVILRE